MQVMSGAPLMQSNLHPPVYALLPPAAVSWLAARILPALFMMCRLPWSAAVKGLIFDAADGIRRRAEKMPLTGLPGSGRPAPAEGIWP
jgi:hypothetical protein